MSNCRHVAATVKPLEVGVLKKLRDAVHLTASRPILTDAHVDVRTAELERKQVVAGPLASALLFRRRQVGETPIFNNNLQLVYMTAALMLHTMTMMMIYASQLPAHWRSHTRDHQNEMY